MVVNDELDVTPDFSFSTVQFRSDVANAIVSSLLTVFILINIVSAVSKLIFCTRQKSFDYASWLRSFIFANSDDPVRIFSWISHNYFYRDKAWNRYRNKLKLQRLILPLLARTFILVASIASVAVSIPGDKHLSGCEKGDYRLRLNPEIQGKAKELNRACIDAPMTTTLGEVRSVLSYCNCPFLFNVEDPEQLEGIARIVSWASTGGVLSTALYSDGKGAGHSFYVQWNEIKDDKAKGVYFYSDLRNLDQRTHLDIVIKAINLETRQTCEKKFDPQPHPSVEGSLFVDLDCSFDPTQLISAVEAYLRSAMQWERLQPGEKEARLLIDTNAPVPQAKRRGDCPIKITVTRPIVNILPLGLMLLLLVVVNIIVSYATSRRGNALDAGFHIIKEALGHDSTSNPLEENQERKEVMELPLRKWRCGAAGAHVGFIGREGDVPIEDFDSSTIVCGCSQVAVELEQAAILPEVPVIPATPLSSSSAGFVPQQQALATPGFVPPSTGLQWQPFSASVDGSQVSEKPTWTTGPAGGSNTGPPP